MDTNQPLSLKESAKKKLPKTIKFLLEDDYDLEILSHIAKNVKLNGRFSNFKQNPIFVQTLFPRFEENNDSFYFRYDHSLHLDWWCEIIIYKSNLNSSIIKGRNVPFQTIISNLIENENGISIRWDSKINLEFWAEFVINY
jgi:hypothetical protein